MSHLLYAESGLERRLLKALVSICCMLSNAEPLNPERAPACLTYGEVPEAGMRSLTKSKTLEISRRC